MHLRFCLLLVVLLCQSVGTTLRADELRSLDSAQVLTKLDLSCSGLEKAARAQAAGDRLAALAALLDYYRKKYTLSAPTDTSRRASNETADRVVKHVFQWGPYEPADYGPDVNWEWDPRGDIEWVAAIYRFYWAPPLADAFRATRDEKYALAFVELASDWIAKHPLEKRNRVHPVYTSWRGFAWLDIQTGIRADSICKVFPVLVHGKSFTPEFLGVLLASLYDHQVKTEKLPMGKVHNKAIFEQRGFVNVATTFPEFRDSRRWLELAMQRVRENFLAQTTGDGVQREWSFGYNLAVLRDAVDILKRMDAAGVSVPDDYRQRIRRMYDYVFAIATPDLAGPMFGDASRSLITMADRTRWPLYRVLSEATDLLSDPKYAARARFDRDRLPSETSYAFPKAGMYVLRNDWGPDQVYLAVHCSPPAISGHDQQDNGTFELCAYGRWLMPDTGYYTYGHDASGRKWHRQTRVHQTLTLDGNNSRVAGRHRLWNISAGLDTLCVENAAYKGLTHRRTIWFVDKRFFVFLDEAIGDAPGMLELHFQLAPGPVTTDLSKHWVSTAFEDANVLVCTGAEASVTMREEEGWFAWKYGHRKPRKAFSFRHHHAAPAAFLTVIFPYRGTERPSVSAKLAPAFQVGADHVECHVQALGKTWQLIRDLD